MKRAAFVALLSFAGLHVSAQAEALQKNPVFDCVETAAVVHHLPPAILVILLHVESGALGHVSENANRTVDIGPMQINSIWVPNIARHWHATESDTYFALRDNFCANVEAAGWILQLAIAEAQGNFWSGVGLYHSHDPEFKNDYLRRVLQKTLQLAAQAHRETVDSGARGG